MNISNDLAHYNDSSQEMQSVLRGCAFETAKSDWLPLTSKCLRERRQVLSCHGYMAEVVAWRPAVMCPLLLHFNAAVALLEDHKPPPQAENCNQKGISL